jgi:hypothetical protein
LAHSASVLPCWVHLKFVLNSLYQQTRFLLIWSTLWTFTSYFVFFMSQEAIFWDESRVGQERDGHIVSWAKMMYMDSSFIIHHSSYSVFVLVTKGLWILLKFFIYNGPNSNFHWLIDWFMCRLFSKRSKTIFMLRKNKLYHKSNRMEITGFY